jgi:hypothetical protein
MPHRWFEDARAVERLACRVASEIENEFHHLAAREHRPTVFGARCRHSGDGGLHFGPFKER